MAEKLKEYSKAIVAFVVTAGTLAGLILAVPGISVLIGPAWLSVLGVIAAAGVVAGGVAVGPANKPSGKQVSDIASEAIKKVGTNVAVSVNDVIDEYVKSVSQQFPQPARTQVEQIGGDLAAVVRNNVDVVVRGAIDSFKAARR